MTQQIINVGTGPDSYTGESLRTAFQKVNDNFSQLYAGNVGANITGNIIRANGFVTSGNVVTGNVVASGNISAYYYTGDGSLLTGITASANTGNLTFSGQTISGTVDGNIVLDPYGSGNVNIPSNLRTEGLRIGNIANSELAVQISGNTASITTAGRGNGNVSLTLSAYSGIGKGSINIRADDGHIGFGIPADGYEYAFNGEVKANAYYADAESPVGYQFTTPSGDTGMSHDYQNDVQGNVSLVLIKHDSIAVAKFYDNNHTVLSGNLVVSQTGNVFGTFPNAFIQTYANINSYSQMVLQNINTGPLASSDVVLTADIGNDSAYFGDFGIASNTYNYLGYGLIKPNDVYMLAVGNNITGPGSAGRANLILGSTTGNINMFVGAPEDANVIAQITTAGFIPGANVTYNLGSSTRQWKDLWLSNSTMYLGGTPITVNNGVLSVNGSPVSSNYGNANVAAYLPTYTGNIAANIVKNGHTWTFDENGRLTFPVSQTSIFGGIDNDFTIDTAANSGPTYTFTFSRLGSLSVPINIDVSGNVNTHQIVGPSAGNVTVTANTQSWLFDNTGMLTLPSEGQIRTVSNTGMRLSAGASDATGLLLNNTSDAELYANANVSIYTGAGNTGWTFDIDGNLTIPGSINAEFISSPAAKISGFDISAENVVANNITATSYITTGSSVKLGSGNVGNIQGNYAVAIGNDAGNLQADYAISIGYVAGQYSQGFGAVAVGYDAGKYSQGSVATALGAEAGKFYQSTTATAVGTRAGNWNQSAGAIAIGKSAAENISNTGVQGFNSIAVGNSAGYIAQSTSAIAIGAYAGLTYQGEYSIAIGANAGRDPSGTSVQAIGNNSIILNATGSRFAGNTASAFYVTPIRAVDGANVSLSYNTTTKEVSYSANTFVSNTYVPSTTGSAGTIGQISFDDSYVYVCVGTNSWKRANLSTW